jgi:hypothetical protein
MAAILRHNKALTVIVAVGIFLIELEIFALAAMKSGRESFLEIRDADGILIYLAESGRLSSFEKSKFEETFGPLDQYQVELVTHEKPFPFRAWLTAAIGFPIGALLLFGFCVRAYSTLFGAAGLKKAAVQTEAGEPPPSTRLEQIVASVSRFNIFIIGALVFLAVLAYWVLPNVIIYVGRNSLDSIVRYRWVFIPIAAAFFVLVAWIIYLRYRLASKAIESQTELRKYRLALERDRNDLIPPSLDYDLSEGEKEQSRPTNSEPDQGVRKPDQQQL